jgi:ubiquinone/menaquinone biosynthesis C-methylase UbiE
LAEESGWQLNGTAPEAYERYIVPAWMSEWAQALVEIAEVGTGQQVLDVACGTGVVARKAVRLVGQSGRVVGLDVNEGMIRAAEYFAKLQGIDTIEWLQGNAASMPFGDAEYDVILCQQGVQFCPDPLATLREMARVMIPGGRLAISTWRELRRYPCFTAFTDVLEAFFGKESMNFVHASFSLADGDRLRDLVNNAGFHNVHIRLEVKMARYPSLEEFIPGYLSATPLAAKIAGMKEQDRSVMSRRIIASLRDYIDDDGLAAPMECHVITADK